MQSKFLLLFSFFIQIGFTQEPPIKAHRLNEKITLDGKLEESAWQAVPPIVYKTQTPDFGKAPSEQHKVLLAYDDEYIYLAGTFQLSDPSFLRGTTYKRDAFDPTTDMFGMVIDSYLDKENGLGFFTSPTGLRWDGTVWNSIAAFLQYNSLNEIYIGNIRFRFNPKEGNDLYIVYNDILNSNRDRELPNLPFSSSRAIILKYTYTFNL